MKIVLDCNAVIICLTSRSPHHVIYQSLATGKFELAVSQDILLEYEEMIQVKYGLATAQSFISLLAVLPNVHFVQPSFKRNLIHADPDDNKYCDCAITGAADYLVTEDKHFNVLRRITYPSITVVSIDEFIQRL